MGRSKRHLWPVWLVVLGLTCARVHAHVQALEAGPGRLRLLYQAEQEGVASVQPGTCLVGLPPDGGVELAVLEAHPASRVPAGPQDAWGDLRLEGPAFLGEVGWVRDQRVVEVGFGPRREADGGVQVFDRVVAELLQH